MTAKEKLVAEIDELRAENQKLQERIKPLENHKSQQEQKERKESEKLYYKACAMSSFLGYPPPIPPPWMNRRKK
jgi:predicted nuclease with TOPRIM domain